MFDNLSEEGKQFMDLLSKIPKARRKEMEDSVYREAKHQLYAYIADFSKQFGVNVTIHVDEKSGDNA